MCRVHISVVDGLCLELSPLKKFTTIIDWCLGEDVLQYPAVNPAIDGKPYKYYYAGGYGESDFLQFGVSSGIKPVYAIICAKTTFICYHS